MLFTVIVVLVVLWALGLFGGFIASGLIHLLLVLAVILLAFRLISGRRVA